MKTFPIMLSGAGLRAVVVGGGPVGLRKAKALQEAGAQVTLIDPQASPRGAEGIRLLRRRYAAPLLRGARLVLACTSDREVNRRIAADARRAGAWVNAADQPDDCDFYLPALIRRGDIVIAIGTGGLAPALAAALKRQLAAALPPRIGPFAALLSRLRLRLRELVPDPRRRTAILRRLAGPAGRKAFLAGGRKSVLTLLDRWVRRRPRRRRGESDTRPGPAHLGAKPG